MDQVEVSTPLWAVAAALVVVLIVAGIFGAFARWILRGRAHLNLTTCIVLSILGTALGLFIAGAIRHDLRVWSPIAIILSLTGSVLLVAGYGAVAAHFQRPQRATTGELIAAGESASVEFKSTARINLRTGEKDARMEQVIVKTVSAFLNADGGTLLVGVDDDGTPLGLDLDYATLRTPDADRYELWLRDLLTTALGQNAAAAVDVAVDEIASPDGPRAVCRIGCSPSPRPVYLRPGKKTPPEFWVRVGNSSRQLGIDEASDYIMQRWPLGAGATLAAQLRAAVRFSEQR